MTHERVNIFLKQIGKRLAIKGLMLLFLLLLLLPAFAVKAQDVAFDFGGPVQGTPGDTIVVKVIPDRVSDLDVGNFNIEMIFDADLFEAIETEDIFAGPIVPNALIKNAPDTNRIRVAWASLTPLEGEGVLLYVTLILAGPGENEAGIRVTEFVFGDGLEITPAIPHKIPVTVIIED